MKHFVLFAIIGLCGNYGWSQTFKGVVEDANTRERLPYVHIGVFNKNMGVISRDDGSFQLDLSRTTASDSIGFSMIGYRTLFLSRKVLNTDSKVTIQLEPIAFELEELVITDTKKVETELFGRTKPTKTTTGQSGIEDFGFGGEWGLRIFNNGKKYIPEEVSFHLRFNTVDSMLCRINFYEVENDMPGNPILKRDLYVTSYKKQKWIVKNIVEERLLIDRDIIATFEIIRIWYGDKGQNNIFITHGGGYEQSPSYSRESSFDKWAINERPPITMFIKGVLID